MLLFCWLRPNSVMEFRDASTTSNIFSPKPIYIVSELYEEEKLEMPARWAPATWLSMKSYPLGCRLDRQGLKPPCAAHRAYEYKDRAGRVYLVTGAPGPVRF